jgi:hypothetical protein
MRPSGGARKKAAPQEDGAARTRSVETQRVSSATYRGQSAAPDCAERGADVCATRRLTCGREIANLPELGDGALHRTLTILQRKYYEPPIPDKYEGQYGHPFGVSKYSRL